MIYRWMDLEWSFLKGRAASINRRDWGWAEVLTGGKCKEAVLVPCISSSVTSWTILNSFPRTEFRRLQVEERVFKKVYFYVVPGEHPVVGILLMGTQDPMLYFYFSWQKCFLKYPRQTFFRNVYEIQRLA